MNTKSTQYQYRQITTTVKKITTSSEAKIQRINNTVNVTHTQERNSTSNDGFNSYHKGKIDLSILKKLNVQWSRCPKCGKMRYKITGGKYIHGTGEEIGLEDITKIKRITKETTETKSTSVDKKYEKYAKYNTASKKCLCGQDHCTCGKAHQSLSVTSTGIKRSSLVKGPIDLTPKIKLTVDLSKFKKTLKQVEEEKKLKELEKSKRIERTTITEEDIYTMNKKKIKRRRPLSL